MRPLVVAAGTLAVAAGVASVVGASGPTGLNDPFGGKPSAAAPVTAPAPAKAPPPPPERREQAQRGVALGMFSEDVSFSYGPLLAEIVALGATHVALVVPLYQTDGASDDLRLHTRLSPTLALVAETIRAARRDGLEVTLFPIVRLAAPKPGEWRGTLAPRDPAKWFQRYGDLLGELAALAQTTGASRLVVGSELSTLDGTATLERWRPLLAAVRGVFAGRLMYSANWDHYRDAKLLDLVDEAGVTGYFELRSAKDAADDATLEAGWRRLRRELEAWRRAEGEGKGFVFTELGYRSRAGTTATPWDEGSRGTVDVEEQRRAFAAFRRAWAGSPALDGVYVWNWYGFGGSATTGYTPRGKPAEREVRELLQGL